MNNELKYITEHLLNNSSLENIAVADLQNIVDEHPYFVAGQLLLAWKLSHSDTNDSNEKVNKAALYFNNPLWLHLLLYGNSATTRNIHIENVSSDTEIIDSTEIQTDNPIGEMNDSDFKEEFSSLSSIPATEELVDNIAEAKQANANHSVDETTFVDHTFSETNHLTEPALQADQDESLNPAFTNSESSDDQSSASESTDLLPDSQDQESSVKDSSPSFEPFHTVDYFASQGIKLQQAELGKDKLGQQLRSFTEWLRSMKRLPQSEMEAPIDDITQRSISRIAEHSIEEKEVLTEAMAEVWTKQGNREKAITIYHKLSLQNPSKSAYFAAKIEQLNSL